ncbi:MAG: hypothetical protein ACK4VI_04225 [Alphaproteobacteria bacterium]
MERVYTGVYRFGKNEQGIKGVFLERVKPRPSAVWVSYNPREPLTTGCMRSVKIQDEFFSTSGLKIRNPLKSGKHHHCSDSSEAKIHPNDVALFDKVCAELATLEEQSPA